MPENLPAPFLPVNPNLSDVIPPYLRDLTRWTAWQAKPAKKAGAKPAKVPLSLTNDKATWRTLADALALPGTAGVGFQLYGVTSIVGLDIDNCIAAGGAYSPTAAAILEAAGRDAYAEVTPSGKGLRLFFSRPEGLLVPEFLSRTHGVECYIGKSARYLTVTGLVLPGRERGWVDLPDRLLRMLSGMAATDAGAITGADAPAIPMPPVDRVAEWQKLFNARLRYGHLTRDQRDFLEQGAVAGGRSELTFGIACAMLSARFEPELAFAILISAPGTWEAALDKRDQDTPRAAALIWADIGRALKVVRAEDADLASRVDGWQSLGLKVTTKGRKLEVLISQANAQRILTASDEWRGRLSLDTSTGLALLDGTPLDDSRFFLMQERVSQFAGWPMNSSRQWWGDAVRAAATESPRNPRAAYLRSLAWDGTQRLDSWFVDRVTAHPSALDQQIGRKWLISLVARWLEPGCKCDTVLVLQGAEGSFKTTFFEVLAGDADRVAYLEGFSRDDKMVMAQAWIVEVPEAHLFRKSDRNRLKAFITKPSDEYRVPYAANPVVIKRGSVLVGTANEGDLFTTDQDGLRRFWVVHARSRIDVAWLREHREQLLAEAVLAYDLEEPWWFESTPDDLRDRVSGAVEATAVDDALLMLIDRRAGQGGLLLHELLAEVTAILGVRPRERDVTPLLYKHGFMRRRAQHARFWLHPKWARPDVPHEADIIPMHRVVKLAEPVTADDEVLA